MSAHGDEDDRDVSALKDHQVAYIFTGSAATDDDIPKRPIKKRKKTLHDDEAKDYDVGFEPLLFGTEESSLVALREKLFREHWSHAEKRIESIREESNEQTLTQISDFIAKTATQTQDRVPTALVCTGPNIASQSLLFEQIAERLKQKLESPVITLRSGDASNMKAMLKKLIREATNSDDDDDDDTRLSGGRKYLNYCFRRLHELVRAQRYQSVVVCFRDSEAFDSGLLAEMVALFYSWIDRIPFVLIFGIATSVDLFQERLSKRAIRCMQGHEFDVEDTDSIIDKIFRDVVAAADTGLRLGSNLVKMLVERQHDHVQSVQDFVNGLKYAYMSHFYANPLSVLLALPEQKQILLQSLNESHYQAIRLLPSFRLLVETYAESNTGQARSLLNSNDALFSEIVATLETRQDKFGRLLRCLCLLRVFDPSLSFTELYTSTFAGTLTPEEATQVATDALERAMPDEVESFVDHLIRVLDSNAFEEIFIPSQYEDNRMTAQLSDIQQKLADLMTRAASIDGQLRSRHAILNDTTVRTTVVNQRVQLSRGKTPATELEYEYSELVEELSNFLTDLLNFEDPRATFLNEVWFYDSRFPIRDIFMPKPRVVVERALSAPHDYLGCLCCGSNGGEGLSATQPATAIVYQLYLESGTMINAFDLWSAFHTIIGGDGSEIDERQALLLFYRALADLKLLGLVKQSKKKADHLIKMAWKGL